MAMRRYRILLLLGAATLLFGCAALPPAIQFGSMALTGMSYIVTGKGPSDHVISAFAEQDCALLRVVEAQPVCIDPQASEKLMASDKKTVAANTARQRTQQTLRFATALPQTKRSRSAPQYYLVLGSFSTASNAQRFRQSLSTIRTDVTRNEQMQAGTTQYRVITGPLAVDESMRRKLEIARTLHKDVWRLRLCVDSLREPPCTNAPTVVASR